MRYAPDHKTCTRNQILVAAGRLFRGDGYKATSIDAVMAEAGLTRGGFYHHFRSKAALLAAIVRTDNHLIRLLERRDGTTPEALAAGAQTILDFYLGPENRDIVARRCTMAALSTEIGRGPQAAREAFAEALDRLSQELSRSLKNPKEHDPRALAATALTIGGAILAQAGGADENLATAMLNACRDEVRRLIEPERPSEKPAQPLAT